MVWEQLDIHIPKEKTLDPYLMPFTDTHTHTQKTRKQNRPQNKSEEEGRRGGGENEEEKRENNKLGVVEHTCNPSTQETEVGGSQVQIQPGLHNKLQKAWAIY
jgi:hypothetical protein